MIQKSHLDELTDGVFSVAMTQRLPESFPRQNSVDLLHSIGQQA